MKKYLLDVTALFWKFVAEGNNCSSGEELKQLESYGELNKYIDDASLIYVEHCALFPDPSKRIKLPSTMQRILLSPDHGQCIYVFPDIHEVFHGIRYLLLIAKNEKVANEIGKCILIMESYIDMQNIMQGVYSIDLDGNSTDAD
jgi:hypothetical protein